MLVFFLLNGLALAIGIVAIPLGMFLKGIYDDWRDERDLKEVHRRLVRLKAREAAIRSRDEELPEELRHDISCMSCRYHQLTYRLGADYEKDYPVAW